MIKDAVLLICHTCEKKYEEKHRAVVRNPTEAGMFMDKHAKCAEEGWGTNLR